MFYSIDGEGKRAGELTMFVRFAGCNLQCVWCDTAYSQDKEAGLEMSIDEIMRLIQTDDCKNVTLTGGEPLIQPDIDLLLEELSKNGYDVNIETNGSANIEAYKEIPNVWFTMDYKTQSSGMNKAMRGKFYLQLREQDVLKIVVGSMEDLEQAKEVITECKANQVKCKMYLSPVFGMIEPKTIVEYMKENNLQGVRIQLQLHKFIWDKNERCV